MTYHLFGIRHHGPGSARSLVQALQKLQPDAILVEGPPDADQILPLLIHPGMQPPVALLLYVPDLPQRAVYYPFARFSPEWQALSYGLKHNISTRFFDLPQMHQLAMSDAVLQQKQPEAEPTPEEQTQEQEAIPEPYTDPLSWLARAAGHSDGERWWELMVEQRHDSSDLFEAIVEAISALRAESPPSPDSIEHVREAWMRREIRRAQQQGFERIAVVCGAWHTPALLELDNAAQDEELLQKLPQVEVQATWAPWTYDRLALRSGYGAGIISPGWYAHLWELGEQGASSQKVAVHWLTRIAQLLREEDLDASAAHVIESVRLAESLAALRERPNPGLAELHEAAQSVFCVGSTAPMALIHERLTVGQVLGAVPEDTPQAPLQRDLSREQRRLRMPAEAGHRDYDLDLRKPNDLDRSRLLHRLSLLGIPWGELTRTGGGKGTFHEDWRVQWQPELVVRLITAGIWGNTIANAAAAYMQSEAEAASELPVLTQIVDKVLLADLPDCIEYVMSRLDNIAALTSDIGHMLAAVPPLANVLRYGTVRNTNTAAVAHVIDSLVTRICIGLPGACGALADDAAAELFPRIIAFHSAIALLQRDDLRDTWLNALGRLIELPNIHGLLAGRACRILLDAQHISADEATRMVSLALSTASAPGMAASWVEGLLRDGGSLLLHQDSLWQAIDSWLMGLSGDAFTHVLPLLRRTISSFAAAERRMLAERARRGDQPSQRSPTSGIKHERGALVLPLALEILGMTGDNT